MSEMIMVKNLRRAHQILIWDKDWAFCQEKGMKGGYVFRKGIEFLENPPQISEEFMRKLAFLQGKLEEKNVIIEELQQKIRDLEVVHGKTQ